MKDVKCKTCRRLGTKLFLRGERCFSAKCAMIKRPYPPGIKGKRRKGAPSEYSRELKEKQKLKSWYGVGERYLKKVVREILEKTRRTKNKEWGDPTKVFIEILESRIDNIVFKMGMASSRAQARQFVSHGFFLVNNRKVDIPSFLAKKGDVIKIKPEKLKKKVFQNISQTIKKQKLPLWLEFNPADFSVKVIAKPHTEEGELPAEISAIFEFYSR